jgi:hypothetical protein
MIWSDIALVQILGGYCTLIFGLIMFFCNGLQEGDIFSLSRSVAGDNLFVCHSLVS